MSKDGPVPERWGEHYRVLKEQLRLWRCDEREADYPWATCANAIEELSTTESLVRDLAGAAQILERVIVELYPGHAEPDAEHIDEYRAVWSAVMDARAVLSRVPKELLNG